MALVFLKGGGTGTNEILSSLCRLISAAKKRKAVWTFYTISSNSFQSGNRKRGRSRGCTSIGNLFYRTNRIAVRRRSPDAGRRCIRVLSYSLRWPITNPIGSLLVSINTRSQGLQVVQIGFGLNPASKKRGHRRESERFSHLYLV